MTLEDLKRAIEGLNEENQSFARSLIETIEKNPQNPQSYLKLSELFWKSHNTEFSKEVLKIALKFDSQNEAIKRKLKWIESFEVRPPIAITGRRVKEELKKRITITIHIVIIAFVVLGILFITLIAKWMFFKPAYKLAKGYDNFVSAKFSPDGKMIAFAQTPYFGSLDTSDALDKWPQKAQIFISDIKGKEKKVVHEVLVYPFETPRCAWLKEGWLAISPPLKEAFDEVIAVDIKSNAKKTIATGGAIWASPDGNFFCYLLTTESGLFANEDLMLVDESMSEKLLASGHIEDVAISEGAKVVAYTKIEHPSYDSNMFYNEAATETLVVKKVAFAFSFERMQTVQLSKDEQNVCCLAISNDGNKIAFISDSPQNRELIVADLNGNQTVAFRTSDDFPWVENPVFSPDGRYLIFEVAIVKSEEDIKELNEKLSQIEKRLKNMKQLMGSLTIWRFTSDLFYVDLTQAQPKAIRYNLKGHQFKHNPSFHPSGKLIAFERTTPDFRTETWIAKFKLK